MSNGVKYHDKDEIIIKNKQDFSMEKFLPELRIHNHTGRNEENYDWRNF